MNTVVDRTAAAPAGHSELRPYLSVRKRRPRHGHRTLDEAQRDLASRFLPLARRLSSPLKALFPFWRDEFESAACLALVEAARVYDPERPIKFSTFARIRIRGALRDVGRAMILPGFGPRQDAPDLVALTPYSEEHGSVMVAVEPPPVGQEYDDVDAVEAWLRKLPSRHARVCRLYYLHGKTQTEIAEVVGCSQSEVTRLHKRAIDLLSNPYRAKADRNRTGSAAFKRPIDLEKPRQSRRPAASACG